MESVKVEMDEVFLLHFPKEDVLFSRQEQEIRAAQLERIAAKSEKEKCTFNILFQDIEGIKTLSTIVKKVNADEIILSKGIKIPTRRILTIDFI